MGLLKRSDLPLERYLYKYLSFHHEVEPFVFNRWTAIPLHRESKKRGEAFFERLTEKETISITVEMPNPHVANLYGLTLLLKQQFKQAMLSHACGFLKAGKGANAGIKDFLEMLDITEEEYQVNTGYIAWKRSDLKKSLDERKRVLGSVM